MNFKTTILLVVALAVVGGVLFFTRESGTQTNEPAPQEKKLLDISTSDVTRLSIVPSDAKPIHLEKVADGWRMTTPLSTSADADAIGSLIAALANLQSRGTVDPSGENASVTGLDQPNFRIELTSRDGKTEKLLVGNKSATGGNLYVQVEGAKTAELVQADVYEQLDKPASALRNLQLVNVRSPEITQLQVTSPKGKLELNKSGEKWVIAGPTTM